jgi:hypothetical protein
MRRLIIFTFFSLTSCANRGPTHEPLALSDDTQVKTPNTPQRSPSSVVETEMIFFDREKSNLKKVKSTFSPEVEALLLN